VTAEFVGVPPIISGTCKATNFKFGRDIHRVHLNKSPLKILEKRERGRIQGLPNFFEYPLLSQERVKLQTSNLAAAFTGPSEHKPCKIWEKRERGRIQGLSKFSEYSIIPASGKAMNFKFGRYIHRVHPNKSPLKIFGKRSVGVSRDCRVF